MTIPRRILPDTVWFITRRCSERRFFLLPNAQTKQVFEYALARAARLTGVVLHAWTVMSNHYHLVVTDPLGRLPQFLQRLNSLVARALNFQYGRKESFWKSGSYNAVELLTEAAILDKMIYTLANPVSAGLVKHAWRWEGASSVGLRFGESRGVKRPAFVRAGEDIEVLTLIAPKSSVNSPTDLDELVRQMLFARENEIEAAIEAKAGTFLGMKAVLEHPWSHAAHSDEGEKKTGSIQPRFAAKDGEILRQAIDTWKKWLDAYHRAKASFCDGVRDAIFPLGTYLMKHVFGVRVAS
ncbi:transposase [Nannocystaceae bacterium ST9]